MDTTVTLHDARVLPVAPLAPSEAEAALEYLGVIGGETPFLRFGEEGVGLTLEQERAHLQSVWDAPTACTVAAWEDHRIVAMLGVSGQARPRTRHVGTLALSVRQSHWGCGLGTALTRIALDLARELRFSRIQLEVRRDNHRARRLYERFGFRIEGVRSGVYQVDGAFFDEVLMARWIDAPAPR